MTASRQPVAPKYFEDVYKRQAFGFPPETYLIAPSLRVYELFMWYDENERWARN